MIRYWHYSNLQSLPILIHQWKNSSIDFITRLSVSTNLKGETYSSILVNWFTKIVHYKPVKMTIDVVALVEVIIKAIVQHRGFPDLIINDQGLVFISKFWSSLCYFFKIKQRLFTTFHPQINSQIKRQNSTLGIYLQIFVNYKKDNWARFLSIAEYAHNNTNNASTNHTPFEFNYSFHPRVTYKKDVDPHSPLKLVDELVTELRELMTICRKNSQNAQKTLKAISQSICKT